MKPRGWLLLGLGFLAGALITVSLRGGASGVRFLQICPLSIVGAASAPQSGDLGALAEVGVK